MLQSKLVTGILAGPNLHPGTPGLTLSQSKALGIQTTAHTGQREGTRAEQEHGDMKMTGCARARELDET